MEWRGLDRRAAATGSTINSYMYGDAKAIAAIARRAGDPATEAEFEKKALRLQEQVESVLWDSSAQFFKVLPRRGGAPLAAIRELHGSHPWYFNPSGRGWSDAAWQQLTDPEGFSAPFGLIAGRASKPWSVLSYQGHECQWNGPSWPYATSVTLTALANRLNGEPQNFLDQRDFFNLLRLGCQIPASL